MDVLSHFLLSALISGPVALNWTRERQVVISPVR